MTEDEKLKTELDRKRQIIVNMQNILATIQDVLNDTIHIEKTVTFGERHKMPAFHLGKEICDAVRSLIRTRLLKEFADLEKQLTPEVIQTTTNLHK